MANSLPTLMVYRLPQSFGSGIGTDRLNNLFGKYYERKNKHSFRLLTGSLGCMTFLATVMSAGVTEYGTL